MSAGTVLRKAPVEVFPRPPTTNFARDRCYGARFRDCSQDLTREHFISQGLMKQIGLNDMTKIAGLSWQPPETFNIVGDKRLGAKILCKRHNNALEPLDKQMIRFAHALQEFDDHLHEDARPESKMCLFAGKDIERWILKSIIGGVESKNLSGYLSDRCIDLLFGRADWLAGTGLYLPLSSDQTWYHSDSFRLNTTIIQETREVAIVDFVVKGLPLRLVLDKGVAAPQNGIHRPKRIVFSKGRRQRIIELSWEEAGFDAVVQLRRRATYDGPPPDWQLWERET